MIKTRTVEVPSDYRCPFCPDHEDEDYVIWEGLMETPICDGCDYELGYFFLMFPNVTVSFQANAIPIADRIPILEKITEKSIYDLQLSFVLSDLDDYYRNPQILDEKISYFSKRMDDEFKNIFIRQERRRWIYGIRYRKKLIRRVMKLQMKIQAVNIHE